MYGVWVVAAKSNVNNLILVVALLLQWQFLLLKNISLLGVPKIKYFISNSPRDGSWELPAYHYNFPVCLWLNEDKINGNEEDKEAVRRHKDYLLRSSANWTRLPVSNLTFLSPSSAKSSKTSLTFFSSRLTV